MSYNFIPKSALIQETGVVAITIPAPGQGKYNCLTSLDVESDNGAGADVTVTSGAVIWQTGITQNESLFKSWKPNVPLIGAENTAIVIAVSAGNYTINVGGYVTP